MRSHVAQLAQLVTRAPGLCLHGHGLSAAPSSLSLAQALCSPAVSGSSHCSSLAVMPSGLLSDRDSSSNGQHLTQRMSQSQQPHCQQQLQSQHLNLESSMMAQLASRHSSNECSSHQPTSHVQPRLHQLHHVSMSQHQPRHLSLQQHAITAHVRHVTTAVSCQQWHADQQDTQHAQRLLSNSTASSTGRPPFSQSRTPSNLHEGIRHFSAFADAGQSQSPDLQKPSFQRAQRPPASQQKPSNEPVHQRKRAAGASSSSSSSPLSSRMPVGPIYRNPKHNPAAPQEPQSKRLKANREITAPEVRLVGDDGQHKVMPLAEALKAAQSAKLDLVEVAGSAVPPVCRLLNHSKASYEAKVKERQAEKKQNENRRVALIKEVHFGAHTAEHDLQVKMKKAKEFLQKGHRVKCTLKHKPVRGQGQRDALKALPALQERMAEFAEVSAPPATEKQSANMLSFYLAPIAEQKQA